MIGKKISHYKIIDKIGEGGMGDVYKARDLRLDRLVALKFLSQDRKFEPDAKKRFKHEAKAASALDHINIGTIYEIDETPDGQMFIAMAFYEGLTLQELLDKRRIDVEETLDIAIQIADGLARAHQGGIIHRDIKPANIVVTKEGIVKIIDFGIAKLAGFTRVTKTNETTGTIPYMSPEQARGEEVDHRTDIFSLGIILYEMLAGVHPFKGEYEAAIMHSILFDEPKPIESLKKDIQRAFEKILALALAKEPDSRYKDAAILAEDLKKVRNDHKSGKGALSGKTKGRKRILAALTVAALIVLSAGYIIYSSYTTGGERFSITEIFKGKSRKDLKAKEENLALAVAPFWGQNEEASQEGLVTQKLIMRKLAQIMGPEERDNILAVDPEEIPRSHSEARRVGRKLGAMMVIWGDVLIYEGEVEIQPYISMLQPRENQKDDSQKPVRFGMADKNQLELRKEKAAEITNSILYTAAIYFKNEDPGKALSLVQKLPDSDSERYIIQGEILFNMGKKEDANQAYKTAINLAPDKARPHLYLGDHYKNIYRFDEALKEYKKAVELEPDYAWAGLDLAYFYSGFDKKESALKEIERVIDLKEEDASIYNYIAYVFNQLGVYKSAIEYYKKAINLEPGNAGYICSLGKAYESEGDSSEALNQYKKAAEIDPSYDWPFILMGNFYSAQGDYDMALKYYQKVKELSPEDFSVYFSLGRINDKLGNRKKAVELFQKGYGYSEDFFGDLSHLFMGYNYLSTEMYDEALMEFQKGIASGSDLDLYYYYSGFAHEKMGNWDKALVDYRSGAKAQSADSLKLGILNNLHYFLSLCRFNRYSEADSLIDNIYKRYKPIDLKWLVLEEDAALDFYTGNKSLEEVLSVSSDGNDQNKDKMIKCSLYYYIAMSYAVNIWADKDSTAVYNEKAREYFTKCIDSCKDCEDSFLLGDRAKMELERLNKI